MGVPADQTDPTETTAAPTTTPTEPTDTPSPCATGHELPYAIPGAEETYQPGSAELRNQTDSETTVTLAIAHDDTTFFECTQTLASGESIPFDGVTATAGEYTVTVTVGDGRSTTTEWRIPSRQTYPMLLVSIRGDDEPVIGCPGNREVSVQVRNQTDSAVTVELSLRRDDQPVAQKAVQVDATSNTDVTLAIPIGDFYTLAVASDAGQARKQISACRGYEDDRITATIGADTVDIESIRKVWE
ncbi:hypothetical protein [Haloarcula litorea]|uniref:hypothetical protein n=1 Tax=Haloarcula litorea TaxID=3032579 RepID=UPI0023E86F14|nr:hypothetical protein [Halomicroarcula sp. GDY20]